MMNPLWIIRPGMKLICPQACNPRSLRVTGITLFSRRTPGAPPAPSKKWGHSIRDGRVTPWDLRAWMTLGGVAYVVGDPSWHQDHQVPCTGSCGVRHAPLLATRSSVAVTLIPRGARRPWVTTRVTCGRRAPSLDRRPPRGNVARRAERTPPVDMARDPQG